MEAIEKLFTDIVASRPPGYLDAAKPLLRRFCERAIEVRRLRVILRDAADAADLRTTCDTIDPLCVVAEEQCELAESLDLLPGDRGKPPPRMQ